MDGSVGFPGQELTALRFLRVRSARGSGVRASVHVCACASEAVASLRRRRVAMAGPPGSGPRLLGLCLSPAPLCCRPLSPRRGLNRPSPQGLEWSQRVLCCPSALVEGNWGSGREGPVCSPRCPEHPEMGAPPPLPGALSPRAPRPVRSGPGGRAGRWRGRCRKHQ